MDINTLREFTTLIVFGSYTAAAKALYMSQPSLSRHIAALEKGLGQQLFFETHPLTLTKAGETVREQAAEIVSSYDTMQAKLKRLPKTKPERIRVQDLMHLEALNTGLLKAIADTEERFPNVTFSIVKYNEPLKPSEALIADKIDVAFQFNITPEPFLPPDLPDDRFRCIRMAHFSGEFRLGIRKDSPLLERDDLHLSDFADSRIFVMASRHAEDLVDDFRSMCLAEGFLPKIEFVPINNYLDYYARDLGDGAIFITRMSKDKHTAFDRYISDGLVTIRPLGKDIARYVSVVLLARNEPRSEAFDFFLDQVEALESNLLDAE